MTRTAATAPDAIFRILKRLGWSVGEVGGASEWTVEVRRDHRQVFASAQT